MCVRMIRSCRLSALNKEDEERNGTHPAHQCIPHNFNVIKLNGRTTTMPAGVWRHPKKAINGPAP